LHMCTRYIRMSVYMYIDIYLDLERERETGTRGPFSLRVKTRYYLPDRKEEDIRRTKSVYARLDECVDDCKEIFI
jgi:hypothetical protein